MYLRLAIDVKMDVMDESLDEAFDELDKQKALEQEHSFHLEM